MAARIAHFTPLPPAPSGIADYAYRVIEALGPYHDAVVVSETPDARVPSGIPVLHPGPTVKRRLKGRVRIYQIGNNWQHRSILEAALSHPGILILHDLQLLYLYEALEQSPADVASLMRRSNPALSQEVSERLAAKDCAPKLPYLLANMLHDVLHGSLRVVVHSSYAKSLIARHFGVDVASRVVVIPHFAIRATGCDRESSRAKLGLDSDDFIVLTAGFATRPKQLDVLAEALEPLVRLNARIRWVHAGKGYDDHFDLAEVLCRFPRTRSVTRITGYVSEEDLDAYVAASDVLVNLRFPSVGESSGSLARALAAGICTIVSDTGAYAELPSDVVIKTPAFGTGRALRERLEVLLSNPDLGEQYGKTAAHFASSELSLTRYVRDLRQTIDAARHMAPLRRGMVRDASGAAHLFGPIEETGDQFGLAAGRGEHGRFVVNPRGKPAGVFYRSGR